MKSELRQNSSRALDRHTSITNPRKKFTVQKINQIIKETESNYETLQKVLTNSKPIGSEQNKSIKNKFSNNAESQLVKDMAIMKEPRVRPLNYELYQQLREKVHVAIQNGKIFSINHTFDSVRHALIKRGWIEKYLPSYLRHLQALPMHVLLVNVAPGNQSELIALSKLLVRPHINFLWQRRGFKMDNTILQLADNAYRDRIKLNKDLDFTTKEGLIGCIETAREKTNIPRIYSVANSKQYKEFLSDYRTIYCLSLLKFISDNAIDCFESNGRVSTKTISFAMERVSADIKYRKHGYKNDYVDIQFDDRDFPDDNAWIDLYSQVDKIVNKEELFNYDESFAKISLIIQCQKLFKDACNYFPNLESYGFNNLWILKPGFMCRGYGIVIKNNFDDMILFAKNNNNMHYIIQKYIERPLLIYKTKFDIRQYMMIRITADSKLNIWMYRDCYLRFSSREYQLSTMDESVHITNNSVQRKYAIASGRNNKLPFHNMWSLREFKNYLDEMNMYSMWDEKIYPEMKKSILAVILTSLEESELEINSFELYGCDFLLNDNYEPILIEINSTPDMSNSTEVTGKICPATLEDVVKVVVDVPNNLRADTGKFELIHTSKQKTIAKTNVTVPM